MKCRLGWEKDNNNGNNVSPGSPGWEDKEDVVVRVKIEEDKQGLGKDFMGMKNFAVKSASASPTGRRSPAWSVISTDSTANGVVNSVVTAGGTTRGVDNSKSFQLN